MPVLGPSARDPDRLAGIGVANGVGDQIRERPREIVGGTDDGQSIVGR